ncbi:MAG TPA: O-antigen ligase family protein [Edaphobacter sp.]|jgi:hypothetical protein|nr:O-antigen ligase family protein [Edaphobacter sp.]
MSAQGSTTGSLRFVNTAPRAQSIPALAVTVGLLAILPTFTNLKIGSFQSEDFVLLLLLGFCTAKFLCSGFSFRIASELRRLFKSYGLLLLLLFFLSILSVRLTFYPLIEASFLKQPVIFSVSKLLQLVATVCGFFWLTNVFIAKKKFFMQALNAYWLTGVAVCFYAIVCYITVAITRSSSQTAIVGAYSSGGIGGARARGFFNEGGPFGIYVVSIFLVGLLRRHVMGRRLGTINIGLLCLAFILSASKAGFFAAALLFLFSIIYAATFRKKVSYLILSVALLWGIAASLNFGDQLYGYLYSFQNIEEQVAARGTDMNLVAGRVSALYIVPQMILAHPVTGIGLGNYPLMRNDPHYLGILPAIPEVEDVGGIGIPGIAAEIGIPATLWLLTLLFTPYWVCRKSASILAVAAVFQPLAHTFAVQLTFFYPWFVSACALAALTYGPTVIHSRRRNRSSPVRPLETSGF